jgi:hypothetical protein
MKLEQLDDLISDSRFLACEFVLNEVIKHLETKGFTLFEILTATAAIAGKRGYQQAEVFIEDGANTIQKLSLKESENEFTDIV